jgi:hypothetical protein
MELLPLATGFDLRAVRRRLGVGRLVDLGSTEGARGLSLELLEDFLLFLGEAWGRWSGAEGERRLVAAEDGAAGEGAGGGNSRGEDATGEERHGYEKQVLYMAVLAWEKVKTESSRKRKRNRMGEEVLMRSGGSDKQISDSLPISRDFLPAAAFLLQLLSSRTLPFSSPFFSLPQFIL